MNLDLDDKQLREIMSAAVLQAITPENKERLLTQAVEHLLTEEPDPYDSKKRRRSPLQRVYGQALVEAARGIVTAQLQDQNSDIYKQVQLVVAEATTKFIGQDREKLTSKLAEKIGEGLENAASSRYD